MRAVNEEGLTLVIFHELRRRLAALEDEELERDRALEILIQAVNQIPGLQASVGQEDQLAVRSASGLHQLPAQNMIDGLCLLWNEYREQSGRTSAP